MTRYRTFWRRFWAGFLDGLIFVPLGAADAYFLSPDRPGVAIVIWGTISYPAYWVYSVLLHARFGQTVGKMASGVRVLDRGEMDLPTLRQAFIRDLPYVVASLASLVYLYVLVASDRYTRAGETEGPAAIIAIAGGIWLVLELLTMLTNSKRRALHDLIAGTVVVRVEK